MADINPSWQATIRHVLCNLSDAILDICVVPREKQNKKKSDTRQAVTSPSLKVEHSSQTCSHLYCCYLDSFAYVHRRLPFEKPAVSRFNFDSYIDCI